MTRAMVFRGTRGTRDFRARFDFDSIPLTYFFSSPFPSLVAERLDCCWIVVESTTVWQFRVETIASRRSKVSPLNTTEIRRSFFECIRETSFSKRRPKQTSVVSIDFEVKQISTDTMIFLRIVCFYAKIYTTRVKKEKRSRKYSYRFCCEKNKSPFKPHFFRFAKNLILRKHSLLIDLSLR